jgi:hypothetical protein
VRTQTWRLKVIGINGTSYERRTERPTHAGCRRTYTPCEQSAASSARASTIPTSPYVTTAVVAGTQRRPRLSTVSAAPAPVRREHQGHLMADTAHRLFAVRAECRGRRGPLLRGGVARRDRGGRRPTPNGRVGVVTEVYELAEGGAVPEIAHPVSVGVVRRPRGRFSQFLVGYLRVNSGRGGTHRPSSGR